jgi:hypothetical protein
MTDQAAILATRLNDERALIFSNLLNGVPAWQVARDFHRSTEQEVMEIFRFILRKIRSRRLERMEPPILGATVEEVRRYRMVCLSILPKLNLDKDPKFQKVMYETVDVRDDGSIRNEDFLRQLKPI